MFHWWWVDPVEPVFSCFFCKLFRGCFQVSCQLWLLAAHRSNGNAHCVSMRPWKEALLGVKYRWTWDIPQRKMNMMLLPVLNPIGFGRVSINVARQRMLVDIYVCCIHIYRVLYCIILSKHVWHSPQILCGWFAFSVTARPLGPGVNMPKSLIIELNPLVWAFGGSVWPNLTLRSNKHGVLPHHLYHVYYFGGIWMFWRLTSWEFARLLSCRADPKNSFSRPGRTSTQRPAAADNTGCFGRC